MQSRTQAIMSTCIGPTILSTLIIMMEVPGETMFGRPKKKDDVDTAKFYNILEVDKAASDTIIKKAVLH